MSKFTDALKVAIEPLRYLIGRNSERIDDNKKRIDHMEANPASIQSDMAQSDPEAPDYIKNCIAYDRRKRTVLFEGDVSTPNYGGGLYVSDDYNFPIKLGGLYQVEVEDLDGKQYSKVNRSIEDTQYGDGWVRIPIGISGDQFTLDHIKAELYPDGSCRTLFYGFIGENYLVRVCEVDEVGAIKTVPTHLISDLPMASDAMLGAVRIEGEVLDEVGAGYHPVNMAKWGALYVKDELPYDYNANGDVLAIQNWELKWAPVKDILPSTVPVMPSAPTSSDFGKIPMVQEDGSWGLGEVPSGSGGGSAGGGKVYSLVCIQHNETPPDFSLDIEFDDLYSMVTRGEMPNIQFIMKQEDVINGAFRLTGIMLNNSVEISMTFDINATLAMMRYTSDGHLAIIDM